jgi:hypothetical protein
MTAVNGTPPAGHAPEACPAPAHGRRPVIWRHDQVPLQQDVIGVGDLQDDTAGGRLLVQSLMRAQLGLSLLCLALALTVTASIPAIAVLVPATRRVTVAGLPLTLVVLGVAIYPVFIAVGWFYNRQARQLEARFTDLVDPKDQRGDT